MTVVSWRKEEYGISWSKERGMQGGSKTKEGGHVVRACKVMAEEESWSG